MRAGLVAVLIGVALAFAPVASAGVFPDLPGLKGAERLTHAQVPKASTGNVTSKAKTETDRVPAPDSKSAVQPLKAPVAQFPTAAQKSFIANLPGGSHLPAFSDSKAASSTRQTADGLGALALVVMVLFTRFLFRLNDMGRSTA